MGERAAADLVVAHSLFADDMLIFCKACPEQLRYVRLILLCFEAVSRLKVNLGKSELPNLCKSELVAVGEVGKMWNLAAYLGCRVASIPMKYLGLHIRIFLCGMV